MSQIKANLVILPDGKLRVVREGEAGFEPEHVVATIDSDTGALTLHVTRAAT